MQVVFKKPLHPGTSPEDYIILSEEEWKEKMRKENEHLREMLKACSER